MFTAEQQAEASKKLKLLQAQEESEKAIKTKIRNVSTGLNDKLKQLTNDDIDTLSKLHENHLTKFLCGQIATNQILLNIEQKLKFQKDQMNRQKITALDQKQRYNKNINQIKETIIKIKKAIEDSIKQQAGNRQKIQDDLDKTMVEIKDKISTFQKEAQELEKQNEGFRAQKEEIIKKMSGLEEEYKTKASLKDESANKDKEDLMNNLKQVENEVNEVTEFSKQVGELQKKNFENKLSIYIRTQKFPQTCSSMQSSATTIDKYRQQLTKGVQRLVKAQQTVKKCDIKCKEINEHCLKKLKVKQEKNEKLNRLKEEKDQIRSRILSLQEQKKQKEALKNV